MDQDSEQASVGEQTQEVQPEHEEANVCVQAHKVEDAEVCVQAQVAHMCESAHEWVRGIEKTLAKAREALQCGSAAPSTRRLVDQLAGYDAATQHA